MQVQDAQKTIGLEVGSGKSWIRPTPSGHVDNQLIASSCVIEPNWVIFEHELQIGQFLPLALGLRKKVFGHEVSNPNQ